MQRKPDVCKGDWSRRCVSISDQCFCIHRLWMILKNDSETGRCKGDQIRGYVSISDIFAFIDPL